MTVSSPAPRFRAASLRNGRVVGELEVSVFHPNLIMDRDGVLRDAALRVAQASLAPPRRGYVEGPWEIELPIGSAWRADAVIERDEEDKAPALLYQTAIAIGHPDFRLSAALFVIIRAAAEGWQDGVNMLESLRFTGRNAPRQAGVELPFTL